MRAPLVLEALFKTGETSGASRKKSICHAENYPDNNPGYDSDAIF